MVDRSGTNMFGPNAVHEDWLDWLDRVLSSISREVSTIVPFMKSVDLPFFIFLDVLSSGIWPFMPSSLRMLKRCNDSACSTL